MVFRFILDKILFLLELTGLMVVEGSNRARTIKYKNRLREYFTHGETTKAYREGMEGVKEGAIPVNYLEMGFIQDAVARERKHKPGAIQSIRYASVLAKSKATKGLDEGDRNVVFGNLKAGYRAMLKKARETNDQKTYQIVHRMFRETFTNYSKNKRPRPSVS